MAPRANSLGWRSHALALAPALIVTLFAYRHAPATFFAQDDITFLSRAAGLSPVSIPFRVLSETLAFRAEFALFGLHPLGYHVVNLALHLLNCVGVYALGVRLGLRRGTAGAAALLFGVSGVAFTPLHWAAGVVEVLTGALLLGATLLYLAARQGGRTSWVWASAALGLLAALSKEAAVVWVVAIAVVEWRSGLFPPRSRALLPALLVSAAFVAWFLLSGQMERFASSAAYARTTSPRLLALNLMTYLRWCVALYEPIRDAIAAIEPNAWRIGLPVLLAAAWGVWHQRHDPRHPMEVGLGWLLAFLLPVLPLAHHTYLFYLYVPWIGGALALAVAGELALARLGGRSAAWAGIAALALFAVVETNNVAEREGLTQDYLPMDRTLRDATLLGHAIPALRAAGLPRGTPVAFVNPVPRRRFDLMTGAPTRPEDVSARASYMPLEAAMRGGQTLRLFLPDLVYRGFATTIPPEWTDAECFLYEQRGWLEDWGRGQAALIRQAEFQAREKRWADALTSWRRVRALGDTLALAVRGERVALSRLGRAGEAAALSDSLARRWPGERTTTEPRDTSNATPTRSPSSH